MKNVVKSLLVVILFSNDGTKINFYFLALQILNCICWQSYIPLGGMPSLAACLACLRSWPGLLDLCLSRAGRPDGLFGPLDLIKTLAGLVEHRVDSITSNFLVSALFKFLF